MRIVSLLPSATEIIYLLGLEEHLVGVTDECDWPPPARQIAVVSRSALPPVAEPAEIDRLVSSSIAGGEPIYRLDAELIRSLRPDLVVTQDLCAVCAVPSGHVQAALDVIGCPAQVVSLDPSSIGQVLANLREVGRATGTEARAELVMTDLQARLDTVKAKTAGATRPRVFALEWGDPPFNGGHWVPEMIEAAGGEPVLGAPEAPSMRVTWEQVEAADPDVVVFMPCGYDLERSALEGESLRHRRELSGAEQFFASYADAFFSRPGPRLIDGVEALAAALHPDLVSPARPEIIRRLD